MALADVCRAAGGLAWSWWLPSWVPLSLRPYFLQGHPVSTLPSIQSDSFRSTNESPSNAPIPTSDRPRDVRHAVESTEIDFVSSHYKICNFPRSTPSAPQLSATRHTTSWRTNCESIGQVLVLVVRSGPHGLQHADAQQSLEVWPRTCSTEPRHEDQGPIKPASTVESFNTESQD